MKKRFLIMATIIVGLGLTACSGDTSGVEEAADKMEKELNEKVEKTDDVAEKTEKPSNVMYQCPDDCQNGPAFFDPGPCESCGKELTIL